MTTHNRQATPARAVIYRRAAADHAELTDRLLEQQSLRCEAFCLNRGWEVVDTFTDTVSTSHERPGYEAMLMAIQAGGVEALVSSSQDRLVRRPSEYDRLWGVLRAANVSLACGSSVYDGDDS